MEDSRIRRFYGILVLTLAGTLIGSARGQDLHLQSETSVAPGLHLWYEITADPEAPANLMICGTKWDALANAPFGFVYASSDSGSSWQQVLEDRSSPWVTEHSCAWGLNHRAYFISEASKIVEGEPHHEFGTTRLFVSVGGGLKSWKETIKTGWADYSTSAVERKTGRLYVFFNARRTRQFSTGPHNNLGLLVFAPDGSRVAGPFLCRKMLGFDYHGVYPTDAIAFKNGSVAALYHSTRRTRTSLEGELGLIHASSDNIPSLTRTVISRFKIDKECLNFSDGTLAYDQRHGRLLVAYVEGCKETRVLLTSSSDGGRTWTRNTVLRESANRAVQFLFPSLVVESDGRLGLLWSAGSSQWSFAQIENQQMRPPIELSRVGAKSERVNQDSLWTVISRDDSRADVGPSGAPIKIDVRTLANSLWRTQGLAVTGDRVFAIWPSSDATGSRLDAGVLEPLFSAEHQADDTGSRDSTEVDVTSQTALVYDGRQIFDNRTGILTLCLAITNRGSQPLKRPIKVQATDIKSPACATSILNAANHQPGAGAVWDISQLLTGDQIPSGATSNPFCLSVRIDFGQQCGSRFDDEDLLGLKMRVLASGSTFAERTTK